MIKRKKMKQYLILGLFFLSPAILLSQMKNRISIQTGLFHVQFDGTPIINTKKIEYGNAPQNMFGGYLNDSWGIMYERYITKRSYISAEYMNCNTKYFAEDFTTLSVPLITSRKIKVLNVNYTRKIPICKNMNLIFGGGVNYIWGKEHIFLENSCNIFGCSSYVLEYNRNDIGLNTRGGIEYNILDWLTVYSYINFIGIIYSNTKNGAGGYHTGENTKNYLSDNYGLHNIPSRFDLSWNFGIGFNFGKK